MRQRKDYISIIKDVVQTDGTKEGYFPLSCLAEIGAYDDGQDKNIPETINLLLINRQGGISVTHSSYGELKSLKLLPINVMKQILSSIEQTLFDIANKPDVTKEWLKGIVRDYKNSKNI